MLENEQGITDQKQTIETAKELLKKYEEKLKNVRNNREYNSIVKEQEYQDLESQLAEKKIKEFKAFIDRKQEAITSVTEKLEERNAHLKAKKEELDTILKETQKNSQYKDLSNFKRVIYWFIRCIQPSCFYSSIVFN